MIYERNNVRVWASDLDPNALLQAERTARLPILAGPVALMAPVVQLTQIVNYKGA